MKYHVKFTTAYKKGYKRAKKRGLDMNLLDDVVDILRKGIKLDAKYHDHALHGDFEGFRECHIQPDWLLVYRYEKDILILTLARTGAHFLFVVLPDCVLRTDGGVCGAHTTA